MVDGQIGFFEDGRELELVGCHLVVSGLAGDAQLEGLHLEVLHEVAHAQGYGTKVVVVHLLVLGRIVTHEGAAGHEQVGASGVESLVDEEVLLFPPEV